MLYLLNRPLFPSGAVGVIGAAPTEPAASAMIADLLERTGDKISFEAVEEIDCHLVEPILGRIADREGITMSAEFVPWSLSRNKDKRHPDANGKPTERPAYSLNWRVTISRRGRAVLATDYSQGMASAPCEKMAKALHSGPPHARHAYRMVAAYEAEHGRPGRFSEMLGTNGAVHSAGKPLQGPGIGEMLSALARDCDVLDAGGFESWASDLGFDPDSRKAEAIYRECVEIATKLRGGLGAELVAELQLVARFN